MPALFVGIDVARTTLDVCIQPLDQTSHMNNGPAAHRKLIKRLQSLAAKPSDIRVVLESTGGFELSLALALEEAGIEVAIIKPERARYFAKATGQLAKTDAIDAGILAQFCQAVPLTIVPLPTEEISHFRDLLDRREQLMNMKTMESNRIPTTTQKQTIQSIENHINWINREIDKIEKEIDHRIAENPQWKELDQIIQSIPGIGPQTARTLIGQLPELGHVNRKVIGQLVGLAPVANDSGTTKGQRCIVGGRKQVRKAMYMAALSAARYNPAASSLYKRLREQGKSAKVALIAVAHKLLTIINAMVQKKTTWQHSHVANLC
jgi:transposase